MKVILISCIAKNGVIGKNGKLAWKVQSEILHFISTVSNGAILCGHNTALNLPKSVLKLEPFGIINDRSLIKNHIAEMEEYLIKRNEICDRLGKGVKRDAIYIIGGAKTYYSAFLENVVDEMILSYLPDEYDGDCYFPLVNWTMWKLQSETDMCEFVVKRYIKCN